MLLNKKRYQLSSFKIEHVMFHKCYHQNHNNKNTFFKYKFEKKTFIFIEIKLFLILKTIKIHLR